MLEWIFRKLCQLRDQKRHNVIKLRWEKESLRKQIQELKEKKEEDKIKEHD